MTLWMSPCRISYWPKSSTEYCRWKISCGSRNISKTRGTFDLFVCHSTWSNILDPECVKNPSRQGTSLSLSLSLYIAVPEPSRWSITREPPREAAGHPSPLAECHVVFMLIMVRLCLFTCSDLHSRPISRSSVHVGWSRNQFPLLTSYIVKFWIRYG